ncbi:hypothetical protein H8356DRAFT_1702048 [Neocallimastix lanati (nom. inval.)]|jgi:acyl-CoA-binding protein|uniref:ACB domain-containing protein n=1 Tax=Neocallimastix californiae TaxID=1754190 RepID=A0A1Y2BVN6_9FUNG|nr:hypothetical protein H8356DRAFT_1702048 [Neocallimastix sp. JGI-2020a]ORY38734.1 hypothetical protein LY90DRAFT_386106 [Neocallimastix californiae]|eukprot:ORY38734.1 hypothetical protein LY90DRAFT_386106 [Neocallimastix californiae]
MSGNEKFDTAAVEVKQLTYRPSDSELLELYSYYKQGTIGDNETDKPGIFDLKASAKWKAWNKVKGMSKEEAQSKYIELVEILKAKN